MASNLAALTPCQTLWWRCGVNNVTGGFVAVVLLLFLVIRHPRLVIVGPLSLMVLWDYGPSGLALLWSVLFLLSLAREHRSTQPARQ